MLVPKVTLWECFRVASDYNEDFHSKRFEGNQPLILTATHLPTEVQPTGRKGNESADGCGTDTFHSFLRGCPWAHRPLLCLRQPEFGNNSVLKPLTFGFWIFRALITPCLLALLSFYCWNRQSFLKTKTRLHLFSPSQAQGLAHVCV